MPAQNSLQQYVKLEQMPRLACPPCLLPYRLSTPTRQPSAPLAIITQSAPKTAMNTHKTTVLRPQTCINLL
jgi:hypothetical protein